MLRKKDLFKVNRDMMDIIQEFPNRKEGIIFNPNKNNRENEYFELFFNPEVYETIIS